MKKLLNTLYIMNEDVILQLRNQAVEVISGQDDEHMHIPLHMLDKIMVFGNPKISNSVLEKCAAEQVGVYFLKQNGHIRFFVQGPTKGNVLLRKNQYLLSESDESLDLAKALIISKVNNEYMILLRTSRNHKELVLSPAMEQIKRIEDSIRMSVSSSELLGFEGIAAKYYFDVFDQLIRSPDPLMRFNGRNRRPPKDRCNALLSFTYTLLQADCIHALECTGLDPYVGFLHSDRPGKPSLALDLMEELRPLIADRFVLRLINLNIITSEDFEESKDGIYLTKSGKKRFLEEWNAFKKTEVKIEDIGSVEKGMFPYLQAQKLSAIIRGESRIYQPISWR